MLRPLYDREKRKKCNEVLWSAVHTKLRNNPICKNLIVKIINLFDILPSVLHRTHTHTLQLEWQWENDGVVDNTPFSSDGKMKHCVHCAQSQSIVVCVLKPKCNRWLWQPRMVSPSKHFHNEVFAFFCHWRMKIREITLFRCANRTGDITFHNRFLMLSSHSTAFDPLKCKWNKRTRHIFRS